MPRTSVGVQEDGKKLALVKEGVSLQQIVDGLNALGIGPRDLITILQAIKAAGADPGRHRGDVMAAPDLTVPLSSIANAASANTQAALKVNAKAMGAAQDFEAMFLNTMFQQMFTGVDGEGPFGGSGAVGVWRSFLTDEYAKSFAKAGGIGIADQVYRSLLAQQEVRQ